MISRGERSRPPQNHFRNDFFWGGSPTPRRLGWYEYHESWYIYIYIYDIYMYIHICYKAWVIHTSVCSHFETHMPTHASSAHLYTYILRHTCQNIHDRYISDMYHKTSMLKQGLATHLYVYISRNTWAVSKSPSVYPSTRGFNFGDDENPYELFRGTLWQPSFWCCSHAKTTVEVGYLSDLFPDTCIWMAAFNNIAGHTKLGQGFLLVFTVLHQTATAILAFVSANFPIILA